MPGNGKTLLAKYIAAKAGIHFLEVCCSTIEDSLLGESSKNMERAFQEAKRCAPCILFLDEIDCMCVNRDNKGLSQHDAKNTINFMVAMNKLADEYKGVLVIGATNRPWILDTAVLSRFGEWTFVPKPGKMDRKAILEVNLKNGCDNSVLSGKQLEQLANLSLNMSAREIGKTL